MSTWTHRGQLLKQTAPRLLLRKLEAPSLAVARLAVIQLFVLGLKEFLSKKDGTTDGSQSK